MENNTQNSEFMSDVTEYISMAEELKAQGMNAEVFVYNNGQPCLWMPNHEEMARAKFYARFLISNLAPSFFNQLWEAKFFRVVTI